MKKRLSLRALPVSTGAQTSPAQPLSWCSWLPGSPGGEGPGLCPCPVALGMSSGPWEASVFLPIRGGLIPKGVWAMMCLGFSISLVNDLEKSRRKENVAIIQLWRNFILQG